MLSDEWRSLFERCFCNDNVRSKPDEAALLQIEYSRFSSHSIVFRCRSIRGASIQTG